MLLVFEVWAAGGGARRAEAWTELAGFISFFRGFADRLHARGEQSLLAACMESPELGGAAGPALLMLHGHDQARRILDTLEAQLERPAPWSPRVQAELLHSVKAYGMRLRRNIEREESFVFPMLEGSLSELDLRRLDAEAEALQGQGGRSGERRRLETLAEAILAGQRR